MAIRARMTRVLVLGAITVGLRAGKVVAQPALDRLSVTETSRIGNPRIDFMRFLNISDVYRAPDGWTYAIDLSSTELRAFDPAGLPAWVVGRRDYDPHDVDFGRWSTPSISVSGDTIVVLDITGDAVHFMNRRTGKPLTVNGRAAYKFRRPSGDFRRLAPTEAGWILVTEVGFPRPAATDEQSVPYSRLIARRFSLANGAIGDTIWTGASGTYSIWVFGDRLTSVPPFSSTRSWIVAGPGMFVVDSGSQIWLHRGKPGPPTRIQIEYPVTPVTPEMVTGYFERLEQRQIDTLSFPARRALPIPPHRSVISTMRVAPDGSIAVNRLDMVATPAEATDSVYIDIWRPTGRRGLAVLPPGFELRQFTGTELVGVINSQNVCGRSSETGIARYCRDIVTYTLR